MCVRDSSSGLSLIFGIYTKIWQIVSIGRDNLIHELLNKASDRNDARAHELEVALSGFEGAHDGNQT